MAVARHEPDPNLLAIRVTSSYPTFRSGRVEPWSAETLDGAWFFERIEEPGAPWCIYHRASANDKTWPLPVATVTRLRDCQLYVSRGWAQECLERFKAEEDARNAAPAATMES